MSNLLYNIASIEFRRLKSVCTKDLGFSVATTSITTENDFGYCTMRLFKDHFIDGICDSSIWLELGMYYDRELDDRTNRPMCLFEARAYTIENCQLQDMYKHPEECILNRKIKVHTPVEAGHTVNLILGLIDVDGVLGVLS